MRPSKDDHDGGLNPEPGLRPRLKRSQQGEISLMAKPTQTQSVVARFARPRSRRTGPMMQSSAACVIVDWQKSAQLQNLWAGINDGTDRYISFVIADRHDEVVAENRAEKRGEENCVLTLHWWKTRRVPKNAIPSLSELQTATSATLGQELSQGHWLGIRQKSKGLFHP